MTQYPIPGNISKGSEICTQENDMKPFTCSSTIYKSEDMATIKRPINGGMEKENYGTSTAWNIT